MSDLVVVGFEDEFKAEEVRSALLRLQREYLVDLEDAVVVVRTKPGKVKLRQLQDMTTTGAVGGGFWGSLVGLLFLNPLFGFAVGAASGAIAGALTDVGISDSFLKDLGKTLKPGSSALCVLVRKATPDKVLAELKGFGGKVLRTSLTHEQEARLQAALDSARKTAEAAG
ncbi:MAG: DUF1269 domain-containing protein [Planctomycetota bacterium]